MNWYRLGGYFLTAGAACWTYLYIISDVPTALVMAVVCGGSSYVWHLMFLD